MKISYGTYPWAMGVPGGGEMQIRSYLNALRKGKNKWLNIEVEFFNQWEPGFHNINIMHYFSCIPSSADFLAYVRFNQHIPVVLSPNFWPDPEGWEKSGVLENIKKILWTADRIIVNSWIEEEAMVRLCNIDSSYISVVHNAVDDIFFEPVSSNLFKEKYNINIPYVLNVANVEPRKNQLAFLKALKNFPDLQLITIGNWREKWYLDACKAEGDNQFRLIGPLDPGSELLRSAIAGCEFFAMPSLRETPSIASLEAAAAGAKILTTDLGSPIEYFEKYVIYINPYDVNSMTEGIQSALIHYNERTLVEHIKTHYRWDSVIEKLVQIYLDVINNLRH